MWAGIENQQPLSARKVITLCSLQTVECVQKHLKKKDTSLHRTVVYFISTLILNPLTFPIDETACIATMMVRGLFVPDYGLQLLYYSFSAQPHIEMCSGYIGPQCLRCWFHNNGPKIVNDFFPAYCFLSSVSLSVIQKLCRQFFHNHWKIQRNSKVVSGSKCVLITYIAKDVFHFHNFPCGLSNSVHSNHHSNNTTLLHF